MGTEVLRPQDFLIHHQRIRVAPVVFPRRKSNYYGNGQSRSNVNGNRKVQVRPEPQQQQQRRRSPEPAPAGPKRSASVGDLKAIRSNQVTILRRGQSPTPPPPSLRTIHGEFSGVISDVYAGSAFSLSPSPRAVPLPSFFNRKTCPNTAGAAVDDSATKDLRRILRLE